MIGKSIPVEQLRNVGSTIARRLREIDIRTRDELRTVGPVTAYRRICAKYPGRTIPVCYYLYSLEGALRDQHWDALGPQVKKKLLDQVSPNKRLQPTALRAAAERPRQRARNVCLAPIQTYGYSDFFVLTFPHGKGPIRVGPQEG